MVVTTYEGRVVETMTLAKRPVTLLELVRAVGIPGNSERKNIAIVYRALQRLVKKRRLRTVGYINCRAYYELYDYSGRDYRPG